LGSWKINLPFVSQPCAEKVIGAQHQDNREVDPWYHHSFFQRLQDKQRLLYHGQHEKANTAK
jgi:hypothetical protein